MIKAPTKGISLPEILVIVAIISMLVLISFPVIKNIKPNIELNGTVRELASDLRWAQQSSVTEQLNYGIIFYEGPDRYELAKFGGSMEILEVLNEKYLPSEIWFSSINCQDNKVAFTPYGSVISQAQIILANSNNETTTVDVRPSGFIKIIN